ncbi:MAG: ribose 5-phosphate isomerase B [Armatimonadota bacterium]
MKLAIGSDHAGYKLKEEVVFFLRKQQIDFTDFGTCSLDPIDYPDVGEKVAEAVASGEFNRGILICGTGIGISIAANKVPGIRAALCSDTFSARSSIEHNNANILALGERTTGPGVAIDIVKTWLATEFPHEERHQRRIDKISDIEDKFSKGGM